MIEHLHHNVHRMKKFTGEKRGRWTVVGDGRIERVGKYPIRFVRAVCECGTARDVRWASLNSATNGSKSCGCLKSEVTSARFSAPVEPRFWSKVARRQGDQCWEWQAASNARGYGTFGANGKSCLAHRLAWELVNGAIPEGMLVCHTCDNPKCCNPQHLWLGTNAENIEDMRRKGRARARRGASNKNAKLSMDQAREVRRLYSAGGVSQQAIADALGVTQRVISLIVRNVSYKES